MSEEETEWQEPAANQDEEVDAEEEVNEEQEDEDYQGRPRRACARTCASYADEPHADGGFQSGDDVEALWECSDDEEGQWAPAKVTARQGGSFLIQWDDPQEFAPTMWLKPSQMRARDRRRPLDAPPAHEKRRSRAPQRWVQTDAGGGRGGARSAKQQPRRLQHNLAATTTTA